MNLCTMLFIYDQTYRFLLLLGFVVENIYTINIRSDNPPCPPPLNTYKHFILIMFFKSQM